MTEVKSLKVTADTYRHRGWLWQNRATYELFKPYMKIPLWVDRLLANSDTSQYFIVGDKDGDNNAMYIGDSATRRRFMFPTSQPERMAYNCNTKPQNGFVVLAERIRAKKPDVNKTPRPLWRQPMTKPWEPGTLGGKWVLDSKLVKEVSLNVVVPDRADRLYISTSGGTATLVWVDSKSLKSTLDRVGIQSAWAKGAVGIRGHQLANDYSYDSVRLHDACHWQLAGVRKKTVWVPAPEVVKPDPNVPMTATAVRAAQAEQDFYGTDSGRVPHLNPLLAAPYGTDIYSKIAQEQDISRNAAKVRLFRDMYTSPFTLLGFDLSASGAALYGSLAPKPPIGVKARSLHDEERANALDEAMVRYLNADLPFPIEWATEWNELRARLNKEQK